MRKWKGTVKVAEELFELGQELMKLINYPSGKHPRRKRSLIISTEEEAADVLAVLTYFIDKNGLNRSKIDKRAAYKYRKWVKRYGDTGTTYTKRHQVKTPKKSSKKPSKKKASKVVSPVKNVSSINQTTKNDLGTS